MSREGVMNRCDVRALIGGIVLWGLFEVQRFGCCEVLQRKLAVRMSLQKSTASAHKLSTGLVRYAPRAILRQDDYMGSRSFSTDLFAGLK